VNSEYSSQGNSTSNRKSYDRRSLRAKKRSEFSRQTAIDINTIASC